MISKEEARESMKRISEGNEFGIDIDNIIEFANQLKPQSITNQPTLDSDVEEAIEHLRVSALDDGKLKLFNKMSIMESYNTIKQALSDNQSKLNAIEEVVNKELDDYDSLDGSEMATLIKIKQIIGGTK